MTTPWQITPEWQGETVAVLASGPSMSAALAQSLRQHRRIVVNHTHRLAPDADILVAMDGNWPNEYRDFAGRRVTGVQDNELDALYIGPRRELVQLSAGHQIEINNSGLTAIRIAEQMGAARIILAGFDPSLSGHWYDKEGESDGETYTGLAAGLAALVLELLGKGIVVDFAAPVDSEAPEKKKRAVRV